MESAQLLTRDDYRQFNLAEAMAEPPFAMFVFTALGMLILIVCIYFWSKKTFRGIQKKITVVSSNAPILMGMLSSHGELVLVADGYTPAGMRFSYILGLSLIYSKHPLNGVYIVELPFIASAHILGVAKGYQLPVKVNVGSSENLEKMILEGDYPNYFDLYIENNQQSEGRYILDPKAMVFTIDFCRQFNWEIVGDQLLVMSDREIMSQDIIDRFIAEIRPSIDSGKPVIRNSHLLPYVTIQPLKMNCPICQEGLKPGEQWLACPNRHGILVTGNQLLSLRTKSSPDLLKSSLTSKDEHGNRKLICPHCHSGMKVVKYQNSEIYIDTCAKCRYRWLDFKEIGDITGIEQNLLIA